MILKIIKQLGDSLGIKVTGKTVWISKESRATLEDENVRSICLEGGYAIVYYYVNGKLERAGLHNFLVKTPPAHVVDHIDRDKLNYKLSNLRVASRAQNCYNKSRRKGKKTPKGVSKQKGRMFSMITVNRKPYHLGYFTRIIEAALAYDIAAKLAFGEFCALNFPDGHPLKMKVLRGMLKSRAIRKTLYTLSDFKTPPPRSSQYTGVYFRGKNKFGQEQWGSWYLNEGIRKHVGVFQTERIAAERRENDILLSGSQSRLNFTKNRKIKR